MPTRTPRHFAAGLILTTVFTAACGGGGVDGKYYNTQTGQFAFELKGGQVLNAQGLGGDALAYQVKGDSIYIGPKGGSIDQTMALAIKPGGVLDNGILGSVTKK
jgi:hypothetical protein